MESPFPWFYTDITGWFITCDFRYDIFAELRNWSRHPKQKSVDRSWRKIHLFRIEISIVKYRVKFACSSMAFTAITTMRIQWVWDFLDKHFVLMTNIDMDPLFHCQLWLVTHCGNYCTSSGPIRTSLCCLKALNWRLKSKMCPGVE